MWTASRGFACSTSSIDCLALIAQLFESLLGCALNAPRRTAVETAHRTARRTRRAAPRRSRFFASPSSLSPHSLDQSTASSPLPASITTSCALELSVHSLNRRRFRLAFSPFSLTALTASPYSSLAADTVRTYTRWLLRTTISRTIRKPTLRRLATSPECFSVTRPCTAPRARTLRGAGCAFRRRATRRIRPRRLQGERLDPPTGRQSLCRQQLSRHERRTRRARPRRSTSRCAR